MKLDTTNTKPSSPPPTAWETPPAPRTFITWPKPAATPVSSQLVSIPLAALDSNPYRDLATYPFVELKVNALKRSIKTVGLWEGVIARKVGDRYQTAFGHHRIEAARRSGLTEAIIILRDLDDKAMLQFMGRENMADYNADFLTMLQTWDAAVAFWPSKDGQAYQPIDIANLLGWTQRWSTFEV